MNAQKQLTRRQFLRLSAGAGIGLVLGVYISGCQSLIPIPDQSADDEAGEEFLPNAFLKISPDNIVTVVVPRMEMGQGVRTALPMIVAEELDADWDMIRVETAPAGEEYGNQETGGSTSIQTYWTPLRQAGAAARQMLITAAAQLWQVDAATCITNNGEVIHQESNQKATYGDLANIASQVPVPEPESLKLKTPDEFQIIGNPVKRVDDPRLVDGSAIFGLDVKVPNMLYAAVARPPVFWGKPAGVDDTKAKAIEGVRDVVEINSGVAVVADSTWAAIQGAQALEIAWDEGESAGLSTEQFRQDIVAQLPDGVTTGNNDAQAQSKGKLDVLYEVPFFAHAPIEPMNCVADARSNYCEVWAPTQNPQLARQVVYSPPDAGRIGRLLRRVTGYSLDSIKINIPLIGGGFGRRLWVDYVSEAVELSQAVDQPVQVVWTREDDIQHDFYHPMSYHHLTAELNPTASIEENTFTPPAGVPTGAWRSVREFTDAYVKECFIDELADALGQDPYELRLQRYEDPRLKNVLQLAAEKADWGSPLPEGWGRGIAAYNTWGKTSAAEVVELSVAEDGQIKVHRVVCVVDCGIAINPDMVKEQMEGGIVFALTAALKSKITIENGRVQQSNFHNYPILRMDEMPLVEVHIVPGSEPPTGVGEMSGPPLTPAVANAVFNATGKRVRHIPILPADLLQI